MILAPREGFEPPNPRIMDFESIAIPGYAISALLLPNLD
tara:strand:+ start:1081 stop:1197 length:117 start_codon:yes stop_codon:yes gene_type:complete